ncbi:MAG TPA: hypothetical protein VE866_01770 [Candidatus Binatia bacterium]|nr:hypothetical protein [Candidatus Binatia bacterium]
MSRHIYSTSTKELGEVTVVLGYDRPLDYVFCTIETTEDTLYSDLGDLDAFNQQDVDYYRSKLAEYNIQVPEAMFEEVKTDQVNRVGNRVVDHSAPAAGGVSGSTSSSDPIIPPGTMAELAAEHKAEHAGQAFCDVCGIWYDNDDPCKLH